MDKPFSFLDGHRNSGHPWDQVLWETPDFVVVPTVGAIIPGWLLVVPKTPVLCVGQLSSSLRKSLMEVKNYCASVIEERYGTAAVFEHGPSVPGSSVGCTVDYAHLHILPAPCDLVGSIPMISCNNPEWRVAKDLDSTAEYFSRGTSYLYIEQPVGKGMIANAAGMPSQLFRRVVANAVGQSSQFNWRDYPMQDNVLATVRTLSGSFGDRRLTASA